MIHYNYNSMGLLLNILYGYAENTATFKSDIQVQLEVDWSLRLFYS